MELMTFEEVSSSLKKKKNRPMSLLLGNGFSIAYDNDIFSYNALYTFLTSQEDALLNKLFGVIRTKNFELVKRTTIGVRSCLLLHFTKLRVRSCNDTFQSNNKGQTTVLI